MNIKKLFAVLAGVSMLATQFIPAGALAATYSSELQGAYDWAYSKSITTMSSIDNANMYGAITRAELAKMLANWAKDEGKTPDTSKACNFTDTASVKGDLATAIVESCQLGLMGQGITAFRPYDTISRAEFGTALSRALWGSKYDGATPYYANHLAALKAAGIMNQISNAESTKEVRGYVMLMLQRSEGSEGSSSEVSESDKLMGCLEKCGKDVDCISACYGDEKEEESSSDEVVKAGSLVVTADSSDDAKVFIGRASDLDILTFKTSEEVEISKVVLERYGYSTPKNVYQVWLENEEGAIISNQAKLDQKGQAKLTIKKDYRNVDGEFRATIVLWAEADDGTGNPEHGALYEITNPGATFGFKVVDVTSTAEDLDLGNYKPATYEAIAYDGSAVILSAKWSATVKEYNFSAWEMYEVAKFKVEAPKDAAIKIKGFTFENDNSNAGLTKLDLHKYFEAAEVTIGGEAVKGLSAETEKNGDLVISFKDFEMEANSKADVIVKISLADDFDAFWNGVLLQLKPGTFNAVDSKVSSRVKLTDIVYTDNIANNKAVEYQFNGWKIKYVSTKLAKVEAAAGATDVVIAEWSLEIPETINADFTVVVSAGGIIEDMRMYIGGEEYDSTPVGNNFRFNEEIAKWGKVQFKVDIDENAAKGSKVSFTTVQMLVGAGGFTALTYDSNTAAPVDAQGSITFTDVTVNKAKASLENKSDDSVEFVAWTPDRQVVFNGTYTAKKADVYLDEFTITAPAAIANNAGKVVFYLSLDNEEVWSVTGAGSDSFTRVKVAAGEAMPVKVEVEFTDPAVESRGNPFTLSLDGEDADGGDVATAVADLATFSVAAKSSLTVTSATAKSTVLLRKANATIASFVVKPDNSKDAYLEDLSINVANITTPAQFAAKDVIVKIDGVSEDGEDFFYDASNAYAVGDIVYNPATPGFYENTTATAANVAWDVANWNNAVIAAYDPANTFALDELVVKEGVVYKNTTAINPAHAWNPDEWTEVANANITLSLNEPLDSDGVTVEVILRSKATGAIRATIASINGKDPSKVFEKRFESALVYVADQKDNKWSTTFVLWVEKAESTDEVSNVCLWYDDWAEQSKCTSPAGSSISDGNDDLEWVNTTNPSTQIMIDAITYCVGKAGCTCLWDSGQPDGQKAGNDAKCVVIQKADYNDYFKVGDTYAKIFKVD